jgi:hypothetical protein
MLLPTLMLSDPIFLLALYFYFIKAINDHFIKAINQDISLLKHNIVRVFQPNCEETEKREQNVHEQ